MALLGMAPTDQHLAPQFGQAPKERRPVRHVVLSEGGAYRCPIAVAWHLERVAPVRLPRDADE
jgi:hypothetical protein